MANRPAGEPRRIALFANCAWNLVNFRLPLIRAFQERGHAVIGLGAADGYEARLPCPFVPVAMDPSGTRPLGDLALLLRIDRALRRHRPDVLLNFTIKPNIYGTLAASRLGIRSINNISGLGTVFVAEGWVTRVARLLYRLSLARAETVFFQNADDRDLFVRLGLVAAEKVQLIPGSGIDTAHFAPRPKTVADGVFRFLFIGRLLGDKGIREYVEAARRIRRARGDIRFQVLGELGAANRTAITRAELDAWIAEGAIDYLGRTDDVRPFIAEADCIVLPSYREGLPRVLLEAASMAKPLIATNVPGCREVVRDAHNGFLFADHDAAALAEAASRMVAADLSLIAEMGRRSRRLVEAGFDHRLAVRAYLDATAPYHRPAIGGNAEATSVVVNLD